MKVYADYNGEVPSGVVVEREGAITRIFFDYGTESREETELEEARTLLVCENVDIVGAIDYGKVVSAVVRDKFSADSVEAILANHAEGTHQEDYDAYQEWRAKAKQIAHTVTDPVEEVEE